jgi:hypothetical protein
MKNISITFFTLISFFLLSCQQSASKKVNKSKAQITTSTNNTQTNVNAPVMTFDRVSHDFGTIKEGEAVVTEFAFTNTGKSDLIIVDARGSCGCTVPKYPKNTPIAPGEDGVISVRFDSNGKPNLQQKTVTISANTSSGREMLRIKAMVTPDPEKQRQRAEQARARQNSNN